MKITQINTYDIQGGAARAAYRLHQGLIEIGHESLMLCRYKTSADETIKSIRPQNMDRCPSEICLSAIQNHYINSNRTHVSNTLFSLPYPGFELSHLDEVLNADVINLHWIAYFQSNTTLKKFFSLQKPVVWTLHDMWAFTGGCHYSAGCKKYEQDCVACPQLFDDPSDLTAVILRDKLDLFSSANLTIVTPSRWLADCANRSNLFKSNRIEVIPNSLETEVFIPLSKFEAKQKLGISPNAVTVLCGSASNNEYRKGFAELAQAIQYCLGNSKFRGLAIAQKIVLLCFGIPGSSLKSIADLPIHLLGTIDSDQRLSEAYSAADILVLPSLEDNLPNVMLESMSCGTPVIGFNQGGIPDLVDDKVTGRVVPLGDTGKLAEAILDCIFNLELCTQMGKNCREMVEERYSITVQAERYAELYQELLKTSSIAKTVSSNRSHNAFLSRDSNMTDAANGGMLAPIDTSLGSEIEAIFDFVSSRALLAEVARLEYQLQQTQEQTQSQLQQTQAQLEQVQEQAQNQLQQVQEQAQHQLQQVQEQAQNQSRRLQQYQEDLFQGEQLLREAEDRNETLRDSLVHERQYRNQLQDQLLSVEITRSKLIQELRQSNEHLKQQFDHLARKSKQLNRENNELSRLAKHLEQEIAFLSTTRAAIRKLFKAILYKLNLFDFFYRRYKSFVPVYNLVFRDGWKPSTIAEIPSESISTFQALPPSVEPSASLKPTLSSVKAASKTGVDMVSPLVEALVVARSVNASVDSELLESLSAFVVDIRKVLCINPSRQLLPILQLLFRRGASITCLECDEEQKHFLFEGIEAIAQNLPEWMIATGKTTFFEYDLLCLGSHSQETLNLLKGRLSPTTKVILSQAASDTDAQQTV